MRAIRRARISSAAQRAGSSSCSQRLGARLSQRGPPGGSGGRKKPSSVARRLPFCGGADPERSAAEVVDEMAQLKQIAKAAQSMRTDVGFPARAHAATMTLVPVSPLGRDQRATAVGEAGQHEQNTAAADTADDGERAALKRMALASNNYRIGKIPAMGSLSPLLSTGSITTDCSPRWRSGFRISHEPSAILLPSAFARR